MITLQNVGISFRAAGAGTKEVVRDVSLHVPKGSLYALIGPGAAGKSVLLKAMGGLVPISRGSIRVGERDLSTLSDMALQAYRSELGFLFQNYALFDTISVLDNVAFPLRREGRMAEPAIIERAKERLAAVSLAGFEDRLPGGLSGGQKKRVGVARATVKGADVLLYDEPAAGLDPVTSQKIFDMLRREQQASGATVVMVSSDLDRMLPTADYVGMLYRGELLFNGTREEAMRSQDPYVKQFVHGQAEGPL